MNVEAAVALATAAAGAAGNGAASAAGQSAWQTLVGLARRATGRPDGSGDATIPAVDATDPDSVRDFTTLLRERALQDGDFATQLCDWAERNRAVIEATQHIDQSPVYNTVSDTAQVSGSVIQARDIHGDINLG